MAQQTAVEWLIEYLTNESIIFIDAFEQAKQMEKEQIVKFANDYIDDDEDLTAEQYYTRLQNDTN